MWTEPLDPMNPRHRAALFAVLLAALALAMIAADVFFPALAAAQVEARL